MRRLTHYLCRLDEKGRAVKVAERKTYQAIRRLEKNQNEGRATVGLSPRFIVTAWHVTEQHAEDHGTVYFFDEKGRAVNMASV